MPTRLISQSEFDRRAGISRSTRKRLRQCDPRFPRLVSVTPHIKRIVEAEGEAYLVELITERDRGVEK